MEGLPVIRSWLLTCLLFGLGCSSARMVSWSGNEGVVAIPRDSDVWPCYSRTEASKLMAEKCPTGYQIVEEGEVVTGKTVISTSPSPVRTQMADSTEYRIKFRPSAQNQMPEERAVPYEGPPLVPTP
jgi:hypothetical protein